MPDLFLRALPPAGCGAAPIGTLETTPGPSEIALLLSTIDELDTPGFLLLSGDQQTNGDKLLLSGDQG